VATPLSIAIYMTTQTFANYKPNTIYVNLVNDSKQSMQYLLYCHFMLINSYLCKENRLTEFCDSTKLYCKYTCITYCKRSNYGLENLTAMGTCCIQLQNTSILSREKFYSTMLSVAKDYITGILYLPQYKITFSSEKGIQNTFNLVLDNHFLFG
jgi:hypothetical protein